MQPLLDAKGAIHTSPGLSSQNQRLPEIQSGGMRRTPNALARQDALGVAKRFARHSRAFVCAETSSQKGTDSTTTHLTRDT
ncbi:MAG: hypothetical protein C5B50_12195 [Verrucomicrobia bacterium]|nr:MAG: hypothetical protein C5B50_12195 [Verrucomicrobiota bacterium]